VCRPNSIGMTLRVKGWEEKQAAGAEQIIWVRKQFLSYHFFAVVGRMGLHEVSVLDMSCKSRELWAFESAHSFPETAWDGNCA